MTKFNIGAYRRENVVNVYATLPGGGQAHEAGDDALGKILAAIETAGQRLDGFEKFNQDQKDNLSHFLGQMDEGSRVFLEYERNIVTAGRMTSDLDATFTEEITDIDLQQTRNDSPPFR